MLTNQDQLLNLVQSLWGSISSNFRVVWFDHDDDRVLVVHFLLERESPTDRMEIEHIMDTFSTTQEDPDIKFDFTVEVSDRDISREDFTPWQAFRRREFYES